MEQRPPEPPSRDDPPSARSASQTAEGPQADGASSAPAGGSSQKEFPCRNCGAMVVYDPSQAALTCPYCGHSNPIPRCQEDIRELDYHAHLGQLASKEAHDVQSVLDCSSCGAQTTLEVNVNAAECGFCGTAIVAAAHDSDVIRPRGMLPFAIGREQAVEAFRKWVQGLWLAPGKFKLYVRTDQSRLHGMYVPYWTYDCHATTWYTGSRGEHYWATESYSTTVNGRSVTRTRQVRRTRWWPVSGVVFNRFDDILILASRSLPQKYARQLEPWDLPNLVSYDERYISGFQSERYQVGLEEGFDQACQNIQPAIRRSIERDIGGDCQRISSTRSQYDGITFKHILLPVWLSAYRYRARSYRFLINARTGQVRGERPWCPWKIAGVVLLVVLAVLLILLLFHLYSRGDAAVDTFLYG